MAPRYLINDEGAAFEAEELDALAKDLDALNPAERATYRNANAQAIAEHSAERMLVVAGPGTGKSSIFKQRVLFWLRKEPAARILALSFVRKLVADLASDIRNDAGLSDEQKSQVDVHTLHKFARSIVEQNGGTADWKFAPHFRIIGQSWKDVVWHDVLLLGGQKKPVGYSWKAFERQVHEDQFDESAEWKRLKKTYYTLCRFYNAAGFCDLILRARDALAEKASLNEHRFFIVDEYQDFNASEENLLNQMTQSATGKLTVGDDDQVLYETLKSGKASLIRAIYSGKGTVNAMLAFCGRCEFHITRAASHFIAQRADPNSIKKIYLPMSEAKGCIKVRVVGCATPSTTVDYIRKFIEDHNAEIEQRRSDLWTGASKDAYLLILSPSAAVNYYRPHGAKDELFKLIRSYSDPSVEFSEDYYKILNYYSLANYPSNNFTFRKVLHYEGINDEELLALLKTGTEGSVALSSIESERVRSVLAKAKIVRDIMDTQVTAAEKVEQLAEHTGISDQRRLRDDLEKDRITKDQVERLEHREEEDAELAELEVKQMCAVELMTIVGSKGLSADHVIIIGFDNVNMGWVTGNAFFVAMTRARKSLHVVTSLGAGGASRAHAFLDQLPDDHLEFCKYTKSSRRSEPFIGRRQFLHYLRTLGEQRRRR